MLKIYLITFSTTNVPDSQLLSLEQYLKDSKDIKAFWNYIPLVYMVKSELSSLELAKKMQRVLGKAHFIVAEVVPSNINGWLPVVGWDWIYEDHTKPVNQIDWLALLEAPKKFKTD